MSDDWWKQAVIYQIYPRSFMDSDGDGVGDLGGIVQRLDHLVDLGVDAIWISPVYPSPMQDAGYDVSDYCAIDPRFGTMADFDALVAALKDRGLKLLMDFVPGHSSDRHPWFLDACSGRGAAKRDWYVWRDPAADGGPPTNWISEFGGPAWTFHAATGQYYLHLFLPEQPSLNWRNPDLQAAMLEAMRFWYDRGVDGFRVDAFENLAPNPEGGDNPPNPDWVDRMGPARAHLSRHTQHQPEVFDAMRAMRRVARDYTPERLLVGEVYAGLDDLMHYYGTAADGFQLPFNFQLIFAEWRAEALAALISAYEAALPDGAWPNWVLGNHDRARVATRAAPWRARAAAMMLLTLRGTPTLYQGDELGMENVEIPSHAVQDPWEKNLPGQGHGRDPVRTPIAWETGPGAGFTTGTPWLPIAARPDWTVSKQRADAGSMLALHRALLRLRRDHAALRRGSLGDVHARDGVLHYTRLHEDGPIRVALNLEPKRRPAPAGRCMLSTHGRDTGSLAPGEGRVLAP
jgi:alpha-glucosidase